MNLTVQENYLIEKLLKTELTKFAFQIGAIEEHGEVLSEKDATSILNLAERLSRKAQTENEKNICLTLCSLIWENRKQEWNALAPFLVKILSRLDLGPTAKMIDSESNGRDEKFSPLYSFIDQLRTVEALCKNEVKIKDHVLLLSEFQKKLWDSIDTQKNLGVSAPTSAGKSFVLVNKVISILLSEIGDAVYIVPTISLITQVTTDLLREIKKLGVTNIKIRQIYSSEEIEDGVSFIYVLTQERALAAFSQKDKPFNNLRIVVVDEIQNIERASDSSEERAHILNDVIQDLKDLKPARFIISGPRIEEIEEFTRGLLHIDGVGLETRTSPVTNFTYAFSQHKKKIVLKQHSPMFSKSLSLPITKPNFAEKFDKKVYDDVFHENLYSVVRCLIKTESVLIFSPTSDQASNTATFLSKKYKESVTSEDLKSLSEYIADTVHPIYALSSSLEKGVAYHHGKLPAHVRNVVEYAFSKQIVNVMTTTTTLMQGVNLPAKTIIARNPYLSIRQVKDRPSKLTKYEFANLRGRAGRLMKDLVGRTLILDEVSFEDSQMSLLDPAEKKLKHGYEERFEGRKDEILQNLKASTPTSVGTSENDLLVYIRQMVMKYKENSIYRLRSVGINLSSNDISEVSKTLGNLAVPAGICLKTPYWDPILLNELFKKSKSSDWVSLPKNPFDSDLVGSIIRALKLIQQTTPYFYDKYFGENNEKRILSIAISAQSLAKELTLRSILDKRNPTDSKMVDDTLKTLSTVVAFKLPQVLRPLISITGDENPILSFIETGAYRPSTRKLIDMGIPRETSIRLSNLSEKYKMSLDSSIEMKMLFHIAEKELTRWDIIQFKEYL